MLFQSAKTDFRKDGWQMAQEAMMMLAQSNLTGNDMKVMWAMLARLDYENLIQVNQAEVSEQVGMNRHNVNRSIKKLIELGVILEGVKIGISRSYRLNPNFGWKGSAKGHREALHEHLKVIKIRGRRAHGAALATLPTCAHLSPDSQARLHRAGSVPCKPKPLNECLRHIFPYCATPKGLANTVGAAHTRVRHGRGAGKTCTLTTERCRLQPVKAGRYAVASQALTGFQLRPLRLVLLPPRRWRGVKGDEVVHFTLDALNRPNTHRRGRWIGFATRPCGLASERGFGAKPQGLVFVFEVVRWM